jgi:hypothetical protein
MSDMSNDKNLNSNDRDIVYETLLNTIVEGKIKLDTYKKQGGVVFDINSNNNYTGNLYEYVCLAVYIDGLKELLNKYNRSSSIHAALENKVQKSETKLHAKEKEYGKIYGESPKKSLSKIPKYSYNELAKAYHEYCKNIFESAPTTNELGNHTKISQATWYRTFKQKEFWEELHHIEEIFIAEEKTELEKHQKLYNHFVEVKLSAQDHIESKSNKKIENKKNNSVPIEEYAEQDISNIDDKIDIDMAIKNMSRKEVIEKIIALNPEIKVQELEKNTDRELKDLFIFLGTQ